MNVKFANSTRGESWRYGRRWKRCAGTARLSAETVW